MKTMIRRHRLLVMSVLLGLAAFALSYSLLSGHVKTVSVVVALRDLESYTKLEPRDIAVVEVPRNGVSRDALGSVSSVAGKFTRAALVGGQQIQGGHLIMDESVAGLSFHTPKGLKSMFLPVSVTRAMGGLISEGEKVDVIVGWKESNAYYDYEKPSAFTALRGVTVSRVVKDVDSGEFTGVVVAMSSDQCERIASYLESATLYLVLDSREDFDE